MLHSLELDEVPEHLFVIGGGYVGLELSQAMRRFGSKVTMIDRNYRLMHREDDDVTEALQNLFEDEGIDIVLNARVKRVSGKEKDELTFAVLSDVGNKVARQFGIVFQFGEKLQKLYPSSAIRSISSTAPMARSTCPCRPHFSSMEKA